MAKHVIIDNGHGRETAGKRSPVWPDGRQLFEWQCTRRIAAMLEEELKGSGVLCTRIVTEFADIPLSTRVQRANHLAMLYPGSVFVSIHNNAGGGTGFEAFTTPGKTVSDRLAELLYQAMAVEFPTAKMRTDMADGDMDKESAFYVLKNTTCPAVLTENFFMDYEPDCRLLLDDAQLRKIARAHAKAIIQYYT